MRNFLQHRKYIIENFCNAFKKPAIKEIWGIELNCNVKVQELAWLDLKLLNYQTFSEGACASGCTIQNPSFLITQYAQCSGTTVFPELFPFNPYNCFYVAPPAQSCGSCCTRVTINNGSTLRLYNYTVKATNAGPLAPVNGATTFTDPALVGYNIQLSLSGYGIFNPGPTGVIRYSYDISTGTITLLTGLLFNTDEVYTIFAYI